MGLDVASAREAIVAEVRRLGTPGGNPKLQAYAGSPYPVLGLSTPQLRGILRAFAAAHRDLTADEVNALAVELWAGPTLEEKALAIMVLNRYSRGLDHRSWRIVDGWVDEATGWALCDSLGSGPVSAMVYRSSSRFREIMRWTRAESIWRRRSSAYALRELVRAGALDRPFVLLTRLLYDPEFWVQRAVGTWLRECWKENRVRTEAFLRRHVAGLLPVVITVATERAPKSFREELRRRRAKARGGTRPDKTVGPRKPPRSRRRG